MPRDRQTQFPFSHVRNRGFLSNHWFENRLSLEPEWDLVRAQARQSLDKLVDLWKREADRVETYGAEASLEHAFIHPVFDALGWKFIYQPQLESWRPDYALFATDQIQDDAMSAGRGSMDFWRRTTVVADAKAWHVPLNRPSVVNTSREFPPQQIERYLYRSHCDYGILTNGRLWRLIPRDHQPHQRRFQTYMECDLPGFLKTWRATRKITDQESLLDEFLPFYLFFSPTAYVRPPELRPLIDRATAGSSEYRVGVGEGLKSRAFRALQYCIEGFFRFAPNDLVPQMHMAKCRAESFVLLYRLLFIMFAEDRRLLPYRKHKAYTDNRSLGGHRDRIAGMLQEVKDGNAADYSESSTALWDDLQTLFDLVNSGHKTYGVAEYNGGLFDDSLHPFLAQKKLSDYHLARAIDHLGRAADPLNPKAGLFRVDYRDLAIQHLGSIYEGLLELQPAQAMENLVVIARCGKGEAESKYIKQSDPVPKGWETIDEPVRKGSIYLKNEKGERRATGSYYTPDHIVKHIVDQTLDPLCQKVSAELKAEIKAAVKSGNDELAARLRTSYDDRILRLRILDPAMGSGHFLLRACQKLAEEIATHPNSGDPGSAALTSDQSTVSYWKRRVIENCLYGVDLNGLAVELAKLALWLETVASDEPLSFLDHHLRHGNSIVGGRLATLGALPDEIELRANRFREQVEARIPVLLEPLGKIASIPSDCAAQVKEKDKAFAEFQKAKEPFRLVGDLWCAAFAGGDVVTADHYQKVIEELGHPKRFASLAAEDWFQQALRTVERDFGRCFHWELEFPEVFFDGSQRRPNPGFDGIIGNPPYDVLSELESKRDLTAFKAFIAADPACDPSRRKKNNLYKLFICRSLELLRTGGHLGFITPMAILGDDSAAAVRRSIIDQGAFTGIEAFPQKDNPAKRVFPEAKLSTAAFTILKGPLDDGPARPFTSRVHDTNVLEEQSPCLSLSTAEIPLYDPENYSIVSCSQADWELATRIFRTGRMHRLRTVAEFFQGEVNETNERKRGVFVDDPEDGKLVTRGASICLYVPRSASQGDELYLDTEAFLDQKDPSSKAYHFQHRRVGLQESSPQNNFRRLIACLIPSHEFCNHTVNYCPEPHCAVPLELLIGILDSNLADWYFRLGSTNAHVSHYQLYNLPFPVFASSADDRDSKLTKQCQQFLHSGRTDQAYDLLLPSLADPPFRLAIRDTIVCAVQQIIAIESERGKISRAARSALDPAAQPYQDFIDRLLFGMAGFTDDEARGLEARLARML